MIDEDSFAENPELVVDCDIETGYVSITVLDRTVYMPINDAVNWTYRLTGYLRWKKFDIDLKEFIQAIKDKKERDKALEEIEKEYPPPEDV